MTTEKEIIGRMALAKEAFERKRRGRPRRDRRWKCNCGEKRQEQDGQKTNETAVLDGLNERRTNDEYEVM